MFCFISLLINKILIDMNLIKKINIIGIKVQINSIF